MIRRLAIAAFASLATAAPAFAHIDPLAHGSLAAGLSHPLFGLDHVLVMVAVGLWASLLASQDQKSALWLVPSAFVAAMSLGFVMALSGIALPFVEPAILASVVVLGLLAASAYTVPAGAGMALVASFALFHGYAHGSEIGTAGLLAFFAGFTISTALLHLSGIGLGRLLGGSAGRIVIRLLGGATALAGLWLAAGA
jgi:urease accessory protein